MPPKFDWEPYHDELRQMYLIDQYTIDQIIEHFRRTHRSITSIPKYVRLKFYIIITNRFLGNVLLNVNSKDGDFKRKK